MASPVLPIIIVAAAAAAIIFAKKKKKEEEQEEGAGREGIVTPTPSGRRPPSPSAGGPEGLGQEMPEIVEPPDDYGLRFPREYEAAVDACVAELGLVEVSAIKACALERIFPDSDALWPPPPTAHQWQRNLWFHKDFNAYVISKWPPTS